MRSVERIMLMKKIVLCLMLTLAACGCEIAGKVANHVHGSGVKKTEKRNVPEFDSLSVDGAYEVAIQSGKSREVQIEGDDNLLPLVVTEVENGRLVVKNEGSFNSKTPLKLLITVPNIRDVSFSGASNVKLSDIKSEKLGIQIDGASTVSASGETKSLSVNVNGAGTVNTKDLTADAVDITSNGAGSIDVYAANTLGATVNGVGTINYYGDPKVVRREVNGFGSINRKSTAQ
jgi:Putative auto-transporter adhesin, head GIN domain